MSRRSVESVGQVSSGRTRPTFTSAQLVEVTGGWQRDRRRHRCVRGGLLPFFAFSSLLAVVSSSAVGSRPSSLVSFARSFFSPMARAACRPPGLAERECCMRSQTHTTNPRDSQTDKIRQTVNAPCGRGPCISRCRASRPRGSRARGAAEPHF
jgi:hypothetical protein